MKRPHILLTVLLVVAATGSLLAFEARKKPSAQAMMCDYNGRTYALEEQRRADDGCNVCTCGENGWSCTKIACAEGESIGTISGALTAYGEAGLAQKVCAINLKDDEQYCQQTTKGETSFVIPAPPGDYWVYAALEGDVTGKRAYHSEFVACGKKAECKDHTPLKVTVESGKAVTVSPQDWEAVGQIDLIEISPSRYEYLTHNYYPTSVFLVKSRGLSKVEFFYATYPPDEAHRDDPEFFPIGEATSTAEIRGIQTWKLPIPPGFQAWYVKAKGTSENGDFLTSRWVWIVRPIETASVDGRLE